MTVPPEATTSPTPPPRAAPAARPDDNGALPPSRRTRRSRRRRRTVAVVAIVGVLVAALLLPAAWFVWELHPPGGAGSRVSVEIRPGWGVKEAGDALQAHGVIGSSLALQLWSKVSGGATFEAGTYHLHTHLGVGAALDALSRGPDATATDDFKLLLPPGLTLDQIATRVGQLPGHSKAAFLAAASSGRVRSRYQAPGQSSLEGLTWPDTYFVADGESDAQILQTIVSAFDRHADAAGLAQAPALTGGTLTPYQALVSASLVQAEAGSAADAANISAVIVNRLRRGIPLQVDATLCYAKGGCPPVPSNADKSIASPYNTYRVTGLPPTPIETVLAPALTAAVHPAAVPYLYYVTGSDGITRFATTQTQQDQNIREHGVRGEG